MAKATEDCILLLRNITGRIDASDPMFTDSIMLQYINDFLQLESTQDIRIFKNRTWYEVTLGPDDPNPYPIDLQTLPLINGQTGASTIEPPSYCAGFALFWFESPADFYRRWPETQTYTPARPTSVLYYNNELTFRNPFDQEYLVKIAAYQVEIQLTPQGTMSSDYLYRYACYGAALDIFSDFGEMDKFNEIYPSFKRYRSMVYARTYSQYQNQRASPEF